MYVSLCVCFGALSLSLSINVDSCTIQHVVFDQIPSSAWCSGKLKWLCPSTYFPIYWSMFRWANYTSPYTPWSYHAHVAIYNVTRQTYQWTNKYDYITWDTLFYLWNSIYFHTHQVFVANTSLTSLNDKSFLYKHCLFYNDGMSISWYSTLLKNIFITI